MLPGLSLAFLLLLFLSLINLVTLCTDILGSRFYPKFLTLRSSHISPLKDLL